MQHIPDNEFDRLFKDRLMDAEVQPGPELWDRIAPQLVTKKKRNTGLYWSAAATVLVALSAGLLFKPQQKIALRAPVELVSSNPIPSPASPSVNVEAVEVSSDQANELDISRSGGNSLPVLSAESNGIRAQLGEGKSLVPMQPAADLDHPVNIASLEQAEPAIAAVLPSKMTGAALATNNPQQPDPPIEELITEPAPQEQQTRPRIRNAGDLVNFVVEKIDKREQKLVEFRTDEDENSSLVAINIGPIKINQRRQR